MAKQSAVLVGPGQEIRSPSRIPTDASDTAFMILPGTYDVSPRKVNWQNVSVRAADSEHPPQLRLSGPARNRHWWITQSEKSGDILLADLTILCDSFGGVIEGRAGIIELLNIGQSNGNLYWGHGGDATFIRNCWSTGTPDKYYVCNFDSTLKLLDWDNSNTPVPVRQGKNEAALRFMQIHTARVQGITVLGIGFKQAVQDRTDGTPDGSGSHYWINCTVKMDPDLADGTKKAGVDIGDMSWKKDMPSPLGLSKWVDCHLDAYLVQAGPRQVIVNGREIGRRGSDQ
jgi:hypothetical protein